MTQSVARRPVKPRHGPFATVCWDAGRRRWVRRLTTAGKKMVDEYLVKYPEPARVLWKADPKLAEYVFNHCDRDAVSQSARYAVVLAAALYDPAKSSFKTHAIIRIRATIQQEFLRNTRKHEPKSKLSLSFVGPDGETAPEPAARQEKMAAEDGWWRSVVAGLPGRQAKLILARYRDGLSYDEIAELLGYSDGRSARETCRTARRKLAVMLTREEVSV